MFQALKRNIYPRPSLYLTLFVCVSEYNINVLYVADPFVSKFYFVIQTNQFKARFIF